MGGTVVGIQQSVANASLEPLKGYRVPGDRCGGLSLNEPLDLLPELRFFDPNKVTDVDLGRHRYPLAADFSAPLASYGRVNENWIGFLNMVRGERMRGGAGLLMMRPYDPARIPVVFVHGLLSSAYVWRNVVNSLAADPEIRRHYQFWAFSYSTGNPIAYSAYLLRDDLQYAQKLYGFKQVVLIGHSMGGILSRMQATNAGRAIWNAQFKAKADQLYARGSCRLAGQTVAHLRSESDGETHHLCFHAASRQYPGERRNRGTWDAPDSITVKVVPRRFPILFWRRRIQ